MFRTSSVISGIFGVLLVLFLLGFFGNRGGISETPDLRVTRNEGIIMGVDRGITITNIGETPVQVQEILYNGGRCKQPPLRPLPTPEMCKKNDELAPRSGLSNQNKDWDFGMHIDCDDPVGAKMKRERPKKFPVTLQEGQSIKRIGHGGLVVTGVPQWRLFE